MRGVNTRTKQSICHPRLSLLFIVRAKIVNAWKADRTVASAVLSEELGKLAARLAGWSSARVAQDDVVWKPPGSGPVAFHQDSAYISRQFIPVRISVWVGDIREGVLREPRAPPVPQ